MRKITTLTTLKIYMSLISEVRPPFHSFVVLQLLSQVRLCNPMDCSMPGFPVVHQIPGACSKSCPLSQWCHPIISSSVVPFFSCLQSFPVSGSFLVSQLFVSSGQSIGVSTTASVVPVDILGWFPLGLTDLTSLQSKGLSRVLSNTTVQKHQFFGV